ncbi:hypothetical protein HBI56_016230 [Parastagonospora nodorum]|nr:hypothetical protein HBH51_075010 [Parastagonospora nodorum]KAH4040885.1 hypothetical protein HBI09_015080 [Parastagonospora nodorum]KAH4069217.1 hypothetical protein HBH50_110410 [Parastagonospora nodorum]KAH4088287.1 hypothetical protein HBH48_127380 [Parastagonospora nodorum]KAH4103475.1 hypothetical protein HBH46_111290 [Parastagonospora nodorum]
MTDQQTSDKRTAPETSSGINSLIAAANKDDRFKLLEDDRVLAGNLENPIHPIFSWFDCDGPMKQMLHLASQFLAHDSVLIFFVPLLYGRELTRNDTKPRRTYLSDPLAHASGLERQEMLAGVRLALRCLAHSIDFRFMKPEKRVYARTLTKTAKAVHTSACSTIFQQRLIAVIEITDHFLRFYHSDDGYKASSRCAQFRHDFLFASTLIHEISHAVGVMRRGNLMEPCVHVDDPDSEWGYAWEQFVFGCVINPQDRTKLGTNLLMRKVWGDATAAEEAGGKEYSDVSMSYIAQWFRQETWDIIANRGPTAIPPPPAHFKIQSSRMCGAWIVSTDCIAIKPDLVALRRAWERQRASLNTLSRETPTSSKIFWRFLDTEKLQRSNVPMPLRVPWSSGKNRGGYQKAIRTTNKPALVPEPESPSCEQTPMKGSISTSHKRKAAEEIEIIRMSKVQKV